MAKRKQMDDVPKVNRGGRPATLKPQQVVLLREIVSQMPHATLEEIAAELEHRGSVRACPATIRRTLRAQGIIRLMPERRAFEVPEPSAAKSGDCGYDAGKKVKGRKRHIVVDTLGLLMAVTVTAASVQDRDGAAAVVAQACRKAPTIERLYTDGAYGGQCAQAIEQAHGIRVEVVRRPGNRSTGTLHDPQQSLWPQPAVGFVVLPKRWVVERTHAWNERWRRMVMHHDRKTSASTAWVWLAEARILLSRLVAAS